MFTGFWKLSQAWDREEVQTNRCLDLLKDSIKYYFEAVCMTEYICVVSVCIYEYMYVWNTSFYVTLTWLNNNENLIL